MTFKLGMLGMHHPHAHGIVQRVAEHPEEFELVGFFDPDSGLVERRQKEWSALLPSVPLFKCAEDLLNEALDGVVVEGRVCENLKWARLALESGRPVLLEKPAGTDIAEFRQVSAIARARKLDLQLLYLFRYMTAVVEILKRGRAGELGQIHEFRARLPKDLCDYDDNARAFDWHPSGVFFEMAGHVIDMMVALLGAPVEVHSFMAHHHPSAGQFTDNGVATFRFDRALGIVEIPALDVAPESRRVEVYGTDGACVIPHLGSGHLENNPVQPIDVFNAGDSGWNRLTLPAATLQIADLREFADCAAERKQPNYSLEHDVIVQESLLKASGVLPC